MCRFAIGIVVFFQRHDFVACYSSNIISNLMMLSYYTHKSGALNYYR